MLVGKHGRATMHPNLKGIPQSNIGGERSMAGVDVPKPGRVEFLKFS
jgi:hypothetical protein